MIEITAGFLEYNQYGSELTFTRNHSMWKRDNFRRHLFALTLAQEKFRLNFDGNAWQTPFYIYRDAMEEFRAHFNGNGRMYSV